MNWQEVINTYPQAWLNFQQHVYHTLGTFTPELPPYFHSNYITFYEHDELHGIGSMQLHIRELYDFFDEQGIKVFAVPVRPSFGWVVVDSSQDKAVDASNEIIATRTEAEEQAFMRAFELLESKLKEGK